MKNQKGAMTLFFLKGRDSFHKGLGGPEEKVQAVCPPIAKFIIICAEQHLWINTVWLYI
jgi:hypothetical protein